MNLNAERSNLTNGQFLMWLGQKLQPDAPLYNMVQTFTFQGELQPDLFREAFGCLVNRSDALRTVIEEVDGVPQRRTPPARSAAGEAMEFIDFSQQPDPEGQYQAWLAERSRRTFDLSARLFDSVLVRLGEGHYVWYLSQHHLITDGWSFYLVYTYTADLYRRLLTGEDPAGFPDPPPYEAYAAFERQNRETESFAKATAYWEAKLAEPAEPVAFYERAGRENSNRTERVAVDLGRERSEQIRQIAGEKGIRGLNQDLTLFNLFATLFVAALHRVGGNRRISLGSPLHNRPTQNFKATIGLFMEVYPWHLAIDEGETFADLFKKVAAESFASLRHAQAGGSRASLNRSYDVLLNFVNVTFPPFCDIPVQVDWVHAGYGDSNHSLRLQVEDFDGSGSYRLHFDFNTGVFGSDERGWFTGHFLRVVDAFLADRDQPIRSVDLLSPQEWQALVVDFNATEAPYPGDQTVVDLFEAQARATPEAVALVFGQQQLTYAGLNERANRLAHHLNALGVGPEDLVAICMEHSLETVVGLLGIMKAGAAYVPLDPAYPKARLAFMLADVSAAAGQAPVLLTQPWLAAGLPDTPARIVLLDPSWQSLEGQSSENLPRQAGPQNLVYVIYTSGSTGQPKGVQIEHRGLTNYLWWAKAQYLGGQKLAFPLFSSLSFDLTVTSIYVPLISGGRVVIYREAGEAPGSIMFDVLAADQVDIIKLTPSHLALINDLDLAASRVKKFIVGGEDFKTGLAEAIARQFQGQVEIYNEYGPTETVVGCMIHRYDPPADQGLSVPIGVPAANAQVYVLDEALNPAPPGIVGEMYIGGHGVARGYLNRPELNQEKFLPNPFRPGERLYRTGDLAKWLPDGKLAFLGRGDDQVKIGGFRIEPGEIEARLRQHPAVRECVVTVAQGPRTGGPEELSYCTRCGLASNYPGVSYDAAGVCNLCQAYDSYKDAARQYFKSMPELQRLLAEQTRRKTGDYDCLVLLSGGKDSTYMLCRLAEMGLKILAFTLDNGYISDGAKDNIRKIVSGLGVDHIFGTTPAMAQIFVESLQQHSNVCNGCFKTLYTLAVNLARQKGIPCIITGLSRGQFFETRLTEDLFRDEHFDPQAIDQAVLAARKAYHRRSDLISRSLEVDIFRSDQVFEDIQFIDFYRYCDASLEDVYAYLDQKVAWVRPADTGRSTNCLINEVGIYLHKKQRGFHNYALPYSWDVRMGQKTREEAVEELQDEIDEERVREMMAEIGYHEPASGALEPSKRLVAYYVPEGEISEGELRRHLEAALPEHMLPAYYIPLDRIPLTPNGKVDRGRLPQPGQARPELEAQFVAPASPLETRLAEIWSEILQVQPIGIQDNFFKLGGSSLPALQLVARVNQAFQLMLPVQQFFEHATIAQLGQLIEDLLLAEIEGLSEAEARQLLEET